MEEKDDDSQPLHQSIENENIINNDTDCQKNEINLNFNKQKNKIYDNKNNELMPKNHEIYTIFLGRQNELNEPLYETNKISTSKYNYITFFPKMLMEQFSRICNIYFLIIAMLQSFKSISYSNGSPLILLSFSSIVLLNGLKDYIEDKKRVESDKKENNNEILIYDKSSKKFIYDIWENIKLGDIIKVRNNQRFPCDIIFLESSPESKGQCKVETKNINGETNLQIKRINNINKNKLDEFNYLCLTKKPNEYIYEFEAILYNIVNLEINKNDILHYNYENFILRGSSLKQTDYIIGCAVYIGHNTKSMKNNPTAKQKISKLEMQMNYQVLFIFIFQVILSILAAFINLLTFYSNNEFIKKFINTYENNDSLMIHLIKIIGTWTLLLTNFVPIPLLTSLEFIKFFQAKFMAFDIDMIQKNTLEKVRIQSSTLNDELGQIKYIFTDKTGTLTKNNMNFRAFTLGYKHFGSLDFLDEKENKDNIIVYEIKDRYGKITNVNFVDNNKELNTELLNKDKNGNYLIEHFFLNIVLNNSVIVDNKKYTQTKELDYLTSSSDEKCLINFARYCGYTFTKRSLDNIITLEKIIDGNKMVKLKYKICKVLEFSSERQRMSVIINSKDSNGNNSYLLYIKGSDYLLSKKVRDKNTDMYKNIMNKINEYSEKGLRILVFGYKVVTEEEYNQFENKYKEIIYDINHKERDLFELYDELEDNIELIGATAIEDELQYKVDNTIEKFVSIGIKVCMLTGDKLETAKSIGSSCKLITPDMSLSYLIDPCDSNEKLENYLINIFNNEYKNNKKRKHCLMITGETFSKITQNNNTINLFIKLFSFSDSIICSRMSPKQKAEVVHIIKSINPEKSTLSIGDGANDVGMILEADIGIGIQGIEGTEACSASDYVLTQFHHLQKLLLFHGRESYRRNSYYIIYEFYKNVVFTSPFIYFGFISFFSGESFYDPMLIQLFDMLYSDLPMFYFAIFDKEYETEEYTKRPELYIQGICNKCFNNRIFWKNMILGYIEGLIIILFCCFLYEYNIEGYTDNDIISVGEVVFSGVVIAINVKALLRVCVIDYILVTLDIIGVALFYFTIFVFSTTDYEYILQPILFIFKEINVYGTNEYIITKKKYLVYFLSIIFFVCFLDIFANRINFRYLKGLFNKDESFILFDKNKYLIEVNNNSLNYSDSYKDEYEKDNIIIDEDYELLKKNISDNKIKNSDFELES